VAVTLANGRPNAWPFCRRFWLCTFSLLLAAIFGLFGLTPDYKKMNIQQLGDHLLARYRDDTIGSRKTLSICRQP
jgi:hypothetical protein